MKKTLLSAIILLILWLYLPGQDTSSRSLRLLFAGDIMGHDSQIESAKTDTTYNYDTCFSLVKPYIESADLAIANLEVTLAGPPFKGYPQFSSPDELADAIRKTGFDVMITANNHSLDRGKKGLERTLSVLQEKNFIYTGTFRDETERSMYCPLILEKNGIRIALLNYTYGTNGLKTESPNIVNYIDKELIIADLQKAKLAEPDFILVTMHWGTEYQREENPEQKELAEFLAKNGADAIIGSHPHVVQPLHIIEADGKKVPVIYSLGNFISNQRNRFTDGGIMFELSLEKKEKAFISDFRYLPVWVYKPEKEKGGNHFVLVPSGEDKEYYDSLSMTEADYSKLIEFNNDTRSHLESMEIFRLELTQLK